MLVLVLGWTQCLPQGVGAPPAMLRGRTAGFPKKLGGSVAHQPRAGCIRLVLTYFHVVVVIDLPLLRVAVEGSDNPVSLEKPCQASLPPDQQGRHSLGRHPEVQYVA